MDSRTINAYNLLARQWVEKYSRLRDKLLHKLALKYFHREKQTLEIGIGGGQDLEFLNSAGFPTTGLDPSEKLLEECGRHFPNYEYILDGLPLLEKIETDSFHNVYSSAVLMHLRRQDISNSLENIFRIMKSKGIFIFSYRHSIEENERERDGRLFTFIDSNWLRDQMESKGFQVLFYEAEDGPHGVKFWHHFAVMKEWI